MEHSLGSRNTEKDARSDIPKSLGDADTQRPAETGPNKRFRIGDVLLGRYRITGELGQGGMGVVYRCFDETAGIDVALKALPPELSHDTCEMEEVRENFRLVAGLVHQNIASVKTLERDPATGDVFLIMECVEGMNLRAWRKAESRSQKTDRGQNGGVALERVLPVLRQIASALDFAHGLKIIHRDVKPANMMLRRDGTVKVLDFGLAAQIHTSLSRVSRVHYGTSGTGPYMAPEQWNGQRQDERTDQYALAATAYELLAGRCPFENHDPAILRQSVLVAEPVPVPGLTKSQNAALLRALAKAPAQRFGSCGAFVAALEGGVKGGREPRMARMARMGLAGAAICAALAYGSYRFYESNKVRQATSVQTAQPSLTDAGSQAAAKKAQDAAAAVEQAKKEKAEKDRLDEEKKVADEKAALAAAEEKRLKDGAEKLKIAEEKAKKNEAERLLAETARRVAAAKQGAETRCELAKKARMAADEVKAKEKAKTPYEAGDRAFTQAADGFAKGEYAAASNLWTTAGLKFLEAVKEAKALPLPAAPVPSKQAVVVAQPAPRTLAPAVTVPAPPQKPAGPEPGKPYTLDLGDGVALEFVYLRPGDFSMGGMDESFKNEWPPHNVMFEKDFWMSKTEVTRGVYMKIMKDQVLSGAEAALAMEGVNWLAAENFVVALNRQIRDAVVRLPTEAEWEYACRAGTAGRFYFGDAVAGLANNAWFERNSLGRVQPVGNKDRANPWGLYDMLGNVAEWCSDWYDAYPGAQGASRDGFMGQTHRVLRGGHYRSRREVLGSSRRSCAKPNESEEECRGIGFRLVLVAK